MRCDRKQLLSHPIFEGIREEELPVMLSCLGSFEKSIKNMKSSFWKAMKSEA